MEEYNARTGEHHIVYEDGDEEYIILALERIGWLAGRPNPDEEGGGGGKRGTTATYTSPSNHQTRGSADGRAAFQGRDSRCSTTRSSL